MPQEAPLDIGDVSCGQPHAAGMATGLRCGIGKEFSTITHEVLRKIDSMMWMLIDPEIGVDRFAADIALKA